ncbi:hypothetical protein [Eleftheria terrae]|uniref:hypothetical protein n=1 Tax=Eleftheria terrae TaxID=1597781 RepID=UPI00263A55A6|nr:hypothetical protein [Eleftheria terrae]WKB54088.1 hypothetical protein N7L95_06770 [Eleftheria terrae]
MQITPLGAGAVAPRPTSGHDAAAAVRGPAAAGPATAASPASAGTAAAVRKRGVRNWNPQLNAQLAGAQQALNFLDDAARQLQQLKAELSGRLAAGQPQDDSSLVQAVERFSQTWQQRSQASAGSLDPQLDHTPPGEARQSFTIRGLDLRSLRSGGAETLAFSVGLPGQKTTRVHLEPGLSDEALLQRLDNALAPAGIRAARDAQGELVFSTLESSWGQVKDSLSVHGGGIRFPGGAFHAVRAEALPEAVRPANWAAQQRASLRQSLQEVLDAIERVRRAREVVQTALAEARQQVDGASPADEAQWAQDFVGSFEAQAQQPGYELLASVAPALVGLGRERVMALLSVGG